jgi:hypothetical protein
MPVRDPAGAAVLERRYRRLLRCYPPTHREFHREEMLGVLLAAARPGTVTARRVGGTRYPPAEPHMTGPVLAHTGLFCGG